MSNPSFKVQCPCCAQTIVIHIDRVVSVHQDPAKSDKIVVPKECYESGYEEDKDEHSLVRYIVGKLKDIEKSTKYRTKSQVLKERNSITGCCDDNADNKGCNCLENAIPDPPSCKQCGGSGMVPCEWSTLLTTCPICNKHSNPTYFCNGSDNKQHDWEEIVTIVGSGRRCKVCNQVETY